jgi:hypothetical protein
MAASLRDHPIGPILRVGDDVIARNAHHRNALLGEVTTERCEPVGDVLHVRAVIADEGDYQGRAGQIVATERAAGGRLGQREGRGGGTEGEHAGLDGHAGQSIAISPVRAPHEVATAKHVAPKLNSTRRAQFPRLAPGDPMPVRV